MDDSDIQSIQDSRNLSSSFTQSGFFVGSPTNISISKWIGDSKKMFNSFIKTPQQEQQIDDFNDLFTTAKTRPRTQSVSSDISVDEHPIGERRGSISERYFSLQGPQPKANEKFNNFRTAITSYYD